MNVILRSLFHNHSANVGLSRGEGLCGEIASIAVTTARFAMMIRSPVVSAKTVSP